MVAGKVRAAMGLKKPPKSSKSEPKSQLPPRSGEGTPQKPTFPRSFGAYFPRASRQVQPRPPDAAELLKIVEELRDRESRLKTEVVEFKLLRESVAIIPVLENQIAAKNAENEMLKNELNDLKMKVSEEREESGRKIKAMEAEIAELRKTASYEECEESLVSSTRKLSGLMAASMKSNLIRNLKKEAKCTDKSAQLVDHAIPAPPPPPLQPAIKTPAAAPPPPPPPPKGGKIGAAKVKRSPEVVEFYHSLMRRDCRKDSGGGAPVGLTAAPNARDMIGEIENRSAHLLAIKTDVEEKGDLIRFLIKEVENAAFTDIEAVVPFVKKLDDELSCLVDERAVLKHFDWPERKADALREAAFGYSDLKRLGSEALSFQDNLCHPCGSSLKKMQALLDKLEQGVHNLSRMKESATKRYKSFQIPVDWMLETGFAVNQIKLASVKVAMKYMKRVSAELEAIGNGPEEEELIVQGVRFAFRVHQFAGGFDVETMRAFQELRDKAKTC